MKGRNKRPTIQFRFRDERQKRLFEEEAKAAGISLNEYILRKIEGPQLDLSRRQV